MNRENYLAADHYYNWCRLSKWANLNFKFIHISNFFTFLNKFCSENLVT